LLVRTIISAISAGTEMLLYRGELPTGPVDRFDTISGALKYPTPYGYSAAGEVIRAGPSADNAWLGRLVFAFHSHCSHFIARPGSLIPVPATLTAEEAIFLPNTETAVTLVHDAAPLLGERVLILGQGVLGLLTAALLHEFPLECLVVADRYERRRAACAEIGIMDTLDAVLPDFRDAALRRTGSAHAGFDLTIEVSGNPTAIDDAIALTAFGGRILVGSWYGAKRAPIDLGGRYHRSRIKIQASQVSTISPELSARWDKPRRLDAAWEALTRLRPGRLITHRFPLQEAVRAYELLDGSPESAIQVVLTYP
jgi:2-desacetyl-2-hydroxyethyl bacteriochlorophyllide A dehydrogenase